MENLIKLVHGGNHLCWILMEKLLPLIEAITLLNPHGGIIVVHRDNHLCWIIMEESLLPYGLLLTLDPHEGIFPQY